MSTWAQAQERSIHSEKGETGMVPGRHGLHAACLGHISTAVFAFKLHSWPILPACLSLPASHMFLFPHIFALQNLTPFLSSFYFYYLVDP